jgi:CheY-like chemotaxis protein
VGRRKEVLPQTILVIEDDPDARLLIQSVLRHAGFLVVLAADGQEGLEKVPSSSPDLIVTDVAMPRLNGLGVIHAIRSTPAYKQVPILAITSFGAERAMDALRAGANRALARPVRNELMLEFVNDLLKQNQGNGQQQSTTSL